MTSGPSPCSATCKRMPFVSTIRCVTSGIVESAQDVGSEPAPFGSAAAASSGSAKAAPTASAPPAQSMSRRENVASRMVLLPRLSCISGLDVGVTPDLQVECTTASSERLFLIMLTVYEAKLHSQARRARRRGGVPERRPARSFRRAAAELAVTPSAISQAVRALEARVGAALFMRTTRSVGLTEAGERFLLRAKPAFEELVAASEVARNLGQRPTGLLRITTPRAVVPILLEPLIASFCQAYPEVEVEIAASEELVDLAAGGFDAGVRLGQFIAADMVAVRLTPPFPFVVVGSPEYLRRRGRPERIDDLRQHACLRMRRSSGSIAPWSYVDGNKTVEAIVSGPLIANVFH